MRYEWYNNVHCKASLIFNLKIKISRKKLKEVHLPIHNLAINGSLVPFKFDGGDDAIISNDAPHTGLKRLESGGL